MLKRSQSGPRARLLRSSSSRNHHWKAHTLAYLGVLLFLFTVAFLQAKPKFSSAAGHASRDPAVEGVADVQHGRGHVRADEEPDQTALERSNLGEGSLWASDEDVETSLFRVSKQLGQQKATNDSFASGLEGDDYEEGDEGNLQEDKEAEVELETEELENLEDPRDNTVEGFDDVDDYEQSEKDELEEQIDLKKRKKGADENFSVEHKEADHLASHESEDSLAVATGTVNTSETGEDGMRNSSGDLETGINRRFYRRFGTEKNNSDGDQRAVNDTEKLQRFYRRFGTEKSNSDSDQTAVNDTKSLQRLGGIKTVPRWAPPEDLTSSSKAAHSSARRSLAQTYKKKANHESYGIIWDHLLGVTRRTHEFKQIKIPSVARKVKLGAVEEERLVSLGEKQGFFNVSSAGNAQIFSSDDEPLDQDLGGRLEEVTAIEDALLLRTDKGSLRYGLLHSRINNSKKKITKGRMNKNQQSSTAPLDPLNPDNNPLLQDPDTVGNGFTSGDNALRKALLRTSIEETPLSRRN